MINHLITGSKLAIMDIPEYSPTSEEQWFYSMKKKAIESRLAHYEAGGEIANLPLGHI